MSFLFGGGDDGSEEAARARQDEVDRQTRIRAGTQRINEIFSGGGVTGYNKLGAGAKYDPTAKYYDASGKVFVPNTAPVTTTARQLVSNSGAPAAAYSTGTGGNAGSGQRGTGGGAGASVYSGSTTGGSSQSGSTSRGTGGGSSYQNVTTTTPGKTAEQAFIDAVNAGKIYSGVNVSKGAFGDDFFANRRKAYIDYAQPQLQKQYQDAQRQLLYALDRGGNSASSAAATQTADLGSLYGTQNQAINDKALGYENEARTAVEDARSDLIKTLNVTGDTEGAARGAINRAAALSKPDTFSPLSQLFADFTATLGTQAAMERAEAAQGKNYAKYDTGLFAPGRVSNK